jgi:predicted phosphodiesterase
MNSYRTLRPIAFVAALVILPFSIAVSSEDALPLKPQSIRFAVIGDNGTGDKAQYEVAQQMEKARAKVGFDFVVMLGDNIYGGDSPADMKRKFEDPYKPLLDAGVKFYASLGNHDNPNQRFYKPFNMNEKRYYSFKKGNAEFFALDSTYMDPRQMDWLSGALRNSSAAWKICYFHHPLYSDGRFHGSDTDLRARIEPVFKATGVRVVLSGHDHLYERVKPHDVICAHTASSTPPIRQRVSTPIVAS